MSKSDTKKEASVKTRKAIVHLLKQNGPMDAVALSSELNVTGMAVRQHLYRLQEERLVDYDEESRPMGRPAKLWRLTAEAARLFPDGYMDLTVSLIDSMKEAFGEAGLEKLLEVRNKKMQDQYAVQLAGTEGIREKLEILADIRTNEGYMAEIAEHEDGDLLFVEKHCPICEAATACTQLCRNELNLFRAVMGDKVHIERSEHLLSGGSRCVYKITK
ncbi:metalloregulator ArsR/SmtB family transcription factor [Paenibacillus sp. MSJ-34]|uniref:helix-turn-helix transcriptional regulator n=1 Tax=Paenibacillus sp. MSJ-34 TaxID=2841529 RepID=UPI001C105BA0|nr:metalloregulator ArsR/SmtB family transcription factor [Paenibacillus sp. MSJ-34]MBU5442394.1 transcriptional regulator [Paenibacillus sp. MSJ-34]